MATKKADVNELKTKALDIAVGQLEKQFGRGTLVRLGDESMLEEIPAISTGSLSLDMAIGIGGLPRGRVVEIFGPEASGKTTLALHAVANAQKNGGIACFIDAEHALDPSFSAKIGVDIDNLLVSQPDTAEQALEICETLVRSNAVDIVVIDSVAALVPKAEVEGDMGDSHMGLTARLMSQALRKLTAAISRSTAPHRRLRTTGIQYRGCCRTEWLLPSSTPSSAGGGRFAVGCLASVRHIWKRNPAAIEGSEQVLSTHGVSRSARVETEADGQTVALLYFFVEKRDRISPRFALPGARSCAPRLLLTQEEFPCQFFPRSVR